MCICVNCKHVKYCKTYILIQKQHQISITYTKSVFMPTNTLIKININNSYKKIQFDWDLIECLSFVEKPGNWLT
uniref:Ycf34 n=1 Tax=Schimmelmannia schousboei TaxID=173468 RepID=A0A1C9C8N4_9FLOR|nr:hypothetical protein Schim_066 [Schimmelmannia schousboei]AOM64747.1 hypothetical protein Schim_066 [Schimmelmannia schousboei]